MKSTLIKIGSGLCGGSELVLEVSLDHVVPDPCPGVAFGAWVERSLGLSRDLYGSAKVALSFRGWSEKAEVLVPCDVVGEIQGIEV